MKVNVIFLLLALGAEIVGTIGGFGSSVFFVPIGNFYFDFYSVLGLTAVFHLSSNLSKIMLFRKGLDKKLIIRIGIPSVIMVIVGGYLSSLFVPYILEIVLGCFLISLSLLFLLKKDFQIAPNFKESIIGGSLSGLSSGILGTGGAIRGLTMAAFNLEKSIFIATSAFIDFMVDLSRTVVYYQNGYIHDHDFIYIPFLFGIGLLGTFIGKRILIKIPQDQFKRLSLVLILIIGVVTIVKVTLW
ncbi:MAG: sulfite exporter TauE/SafE family protein [Fulvivirga sp.]|uniref:sulfite exporter TauE/SafE family protein n=1 Tax=Fulvivirga sp. TaxID=1931237 RepID=UPI0032ED713E